MNRYILPLLFSIPFFCSAQTNGYLKGKISDKSSGELLPGATISASGNSGASSDIDGNYLIALPEGEAAIEVNLLGYKSLLRKVTVKANDTISLDFNLEPENKILDEVVISAGKFEQKLSDVTVSMEVIKPSLIQNKNAVQLDQIMNQVPSVNISDSQISIRSGSGFSYGAGSRVLLMVDEMPMISADAADIKWNFLPIENVEQVEVIKGASSALYGSSALNGVVNFRTAYPRDKPQTTITTFYGVYGNPRAEQVNYHQGQKNPEYKGTNFFHSQKVGQLDLIISGQLYDNDGYRLYETEKRARANLNLRYNFKKAKGLAVGVNTNYMATNGGLFFLWAGPDSAYYPQYSADSPTRSIQIYDNRRLSVDPYIVFNTEKTGRISLRTRYFGTVNTNNKNQESTAALLYSDLQWQKRFRNNFTMTIGYVYTGQDVRSDSLYGRRKGLNHAGYAQFDKKIKKLTLSLGLRGEYYKVDTARTKGTLFNDKITDLPFQPVMRAGANYQLFEYTFLRSSFGQGYRFPSIAEKYISTNVSALKLFPNNKLQPERGWTSEVGIKQGFKIFNFKGFLDAAYYWTRYRNMMDFVYTRTIPDSLIFQGLYSIQEIVANSGFQSQNIGKAKITGVDFSLTGTGSIGKVNLTLLTGYTYSNPINPDFNPAKDTTGSFKGSNLLKYRSQHLFKNDIQVDYKGFSAGFSSRFTSFMENIDKRFEEPIIYELMNPNYALYYDPSFYVLPGLKQYRLKHKHDGWQHDMRISYMISKNLKISYIVNNVFNQLYMSRPGFLEPPKTRVVQLVMKF
jgi:iron complex outermembrane receptor protein